MQIHLTHTSCRLTLHIRELCLYEIIYLVVNPSQWPIPESQSKMCGSRPANSNCVELQDISSVDIRSQALLLLRPPIWVPNHPTILFVCLVKLKPTLNVTLPLAPLATNGELWVDTPNSSRFSVRIKQIQLEQVCQLWVSCMAFLQVHT